MKSILMSRFDLSDIDDAHSLIQSTIFECYSGIYPENALKFFQDMYTRDTILEKGANGITVVARRSGRIIGIGSVHGNEISGVFISRQMQGQGIGREVMSYLEKHIVESNESSSTLSVSLPSFNFYKAIGYSDFIEQSIDVGEGQKLHYWKAIKQLV